ncbi:CorA-like Mg2+ transporter protein [Streptococcus pneumoniae]|nr:CorA-like Mg2+ transporter protein [Streptococcus pneumoniae]
MVLEKQLGNGCTWIDLDLGKLNKLEDLSEIYGLDKETIEYALDRNERAHMDYHRESGTVTFIYNVLDVKKDKAYYETFPMTSCASELPRKTSLPCLIWRLVWFI